MTLLRPARIAALLWTLAAVPLSSPSQNQSLPPLPPTETRFFPLADVRPGQRGVAYTVFQGVVPEPMEVEILGVLKNSLGPNRDMILARLHGTKPDYTGVVAGMSGSPVYLDGKLLGALSFRIGQFSKEPIAGITPIAEMLDVANLPAATPKTPAPSPAPPKTSSPSKPRSSFPASPRRPSTASATASAPSVSPRSPVSAAIAPAPLSLSPSSPAPPSAPSSSAATSPWPAPAPSPTSTPHACSPAAIPLPRAARSPCP